MMGTPDPSGSPQRSPACCVAHLAWDSRRQIFPDAPHGRAARSHPQVRV